MVFFLTSVAHSQSCVCSSPTNLTVQWAKSFSKAANQDEVSYRVIAIEEDGSPCTNDGYVIVGYSSNGTTHQDAWVLRIDSDGNQVWSNTYDINSGNDVAYSVIQTHDNYLLVCGASQNNHFDYTTPTYSTDAWVLKLNLDGSTATGWTQTWNSTTYPGKFYGSSGSTSTDIAYDIAEDPASPYDYIVVGEGWSSNNDVPTGTQGDGDIWMFKIGNSSGSIVSGKNIVYHGSTSITDPSPDFARRIRTDCKSGNNEYIIAGFCESCDPSPGTKSHSQGILYEMSSSFGTPTIQTHGSNAAHKPWDYGYFDVLQTQQPFKTCSDSFVTTGIQHPTSKSIGCWTNHHDVWLTKSKSYFTDDNTYVSSCINADVGSAHGGVYQDNGQAAVQTCSGMVVVGFTFSNDQVTWQHNAASGEVTCNHYACSDSATSDVWIAMTSANSGDLLWNESLGGSGNDGAYSIIRAPNGSYVVAGYDSAGVTDNNGKKDFYIINFELNSTCTKPAGVSYSKSTCCATVSWTMEPCVPYYILKYKKATSATWTTVYNVTSPYQFCNTTNSNANYLFTLQASCSPHHVSDTAYRAIGGLSYGCAKIESENENASNDNLLSVYPNPASASFEISLQLSPIDIREIATINILNQVGKVQSSILQPVREDGLLQTKLSVKNYPSGFYLVSVSIGGRTFQSKLILQKE